ncbi:MAG: hypothetical protein RLZZ401_1755 [Pseudomonadota bacterium]|jgi:competence protein ComEC
MNTWRFALTHWLTWSGQRRPVLGAAALGVLAGTALQLQQAALFDPLIYGLICLLSLICCGLCASKKIAYRAWRGGSLLLAVTALVGSLCGLRASLYLSQGLSPALEGQDLALVGTVSTLPQSNAAGTRFRFAVEQAHQQGVAVALPPRVTLGWYGDPAGGAVTVPELRVGQRWQLTARLKAPHGNTNPGGFDYELWLWEQGVQATGAVRPLSGPGDSAQAPRLLAQTWLHPVEQARQAVRSAILAQVADRRSAGIVAALLVGDQAAIERADWDIFRATGVAHLMSISGLHVTSFAWAAALLVGWGWRRSTRLCLLLPAPLAGLLGGVLLASAYALFSGWGVPAQRTVLMLAVATGLRLSGVHWPVYRVWLLAMAVVLLCDPWALLSAGFWLSFVAVGILFATNTEADKSSQKSGQRHFYSLFREQAVVTLALTPLGLLLFGQFSVVGLLANLVAIPWVTLVCTPLALAGLLWAGLWSVSAVALQGLAWLLTGLASWPFASVTVATPALWAAVAGVLGGALLALRLPLGVRWLGLPLLLPALLWQAPRPPVGQFDLLATDVGQGTAVRVRTAHHSLLYDAGPRWGPESDAGHRVLLPLLRHTDERLDRLVLSHRDLDHTGGAQAVLAMQPQADVLSSLEASHALNSLRPPTRCEAGQHWQWDGVDFTVLHPSALDYDQAAKPNVLSCVLRIGNGAQVVLLTGDIEAAQEARLVQQQAGALKADVLLVPHHGSRTSSTPAFLDAVAPRIALVQAGYRNRFGHPAPGVLARYQQRGIRLVDSVHCGAASWGSVEPQALDCQRQTHQRYWQHQPP